MSATTVRVAFGAATQIFSNPLFQIQDKGFIAATGASAVRRPDFNGDGRFDLLIYACFWDDEPPVGCLASPRWYQLTGELRAISDRRL